VDESKTLWRVGAIAGIGVGLVLDAFGAYFLVTAFDGPFDVDRARVAALLLVGGALMMTPGIFLDRRARERLRGGPNLGGSNAKTIRTIGTIGVVIGVVGIGLGLVASASKMAGVDGLPSWLFLSAQLGLDALFVAAGLAMRRWAGASELGRESGDRATS
jgi:hypothetical protein